MRICLLLIFAVFLNVSCRTAFLNKEGITKIEKEKREKDSLVLIAAEKERIAFMSEQARLDSIHKADSIAALPPPVNYDTVLVASLLRTPCYGACRHYEIRIYASGYAEYIGYANVAKKGKYETRVDKEIIMQIYDRAAQIHYMDFADKYPESGRGIADFPMCVSSVFNGTDKKVVYNRNDAPKELVLFEHFIDSLFDEIEWKLINSVSESFDSVEKD